MGTFSVDSITKYIDFYSMIKNRNAKYPFAIFNTSKENEPGNTGGVFQIFNQKIICFYLILQVQMDLKYLQ